MADLQKITALANLVDQLEQRLYPTEQERFKALHDDLWKEWDERFDDLWGELKRARDRLLRCLVRTDNMLVGAEYCNECGEVEGVVTGIDREPPLAILLAPAGDVSPEELYGSYFRLPGSDAYGDQALVELARQRAATAAT